MIKEATAVRRALERWTATGLVDDATAARLRAESDAHAERSRLSFTRLLLGVTAGIVLVTAAITFTAWLWPELGVPARCAFLAVAGVLLAAFGGRLELGPRREPAWLLQAGGLVLIAIACGYSAEAWPNGSVGGAVAGWAAALTGVAALWFYAGRSDVMLVIAVVLGYIFLILLGVRAFGAEEGTVWLLDGALLVEAAIVLLLLRRTPCPRWVPAAAGALLYLTPLRLLFTLIGPLELDGDIAIWPVNAWLIATTALLLRLRERHPDQDVYAWGLAVSVLLGMWFAFYTTLGALHLDAEFAALAVAAVGGLALWYAVPRGERDVLLAGALVLVIAAWYYAAERGEALSAFLALGFTAGLLFWVATRVGRKQERAAQPITGS